MKQRASGSLAPGLLSPIVVFPRELESAATVATQGVKRSAGISFVGQAADQIESFVCSVSAATSTLTAPANHTNWWSVVAAIVVVVVVALFLLLTTQLQPRRSRPASPNVVTGATHADVSCRRKPASDGVAKLVVSFASICSIWFEWWSVGRSAG